MGKDGEPYHLNPERLHPLSGKGLIAGSLPTLGHSLPKEAGLPASRMSLRCLRICKALGSQGNVFRCQGHPNPAESMLGCLPVETKSRSSDEVERWWGLDAEKDQGCMSGKDARPSTAK